MRATIRLVKNRAKPERPTTLFDFILEPPLVCSRVELLLRALT